MVNSKREWHNPVKFVEHATEGRCPYCHKHVKSLEDHIQDKHKEEK